MIFFRYGAPIDATPGVGCVRHAGIVGTIALPHLKGVAAGHVFSTYARQTASASTGGTSLMRLPSVGVVVHALAATAGHTNPAVARQRSRPVSRIRLSVSS
jgi:hypothetical protein